MKRYYKFEEIQLNTKTILDEETGEPEYLDTNEDQVYSILCNLDISKEDPKIVMKYNKVLSKGFNALFNKILGDTSQKKFDSEVFEDSGYVFLVHNNIPILNSIQIPDEFYLKIEKAFEVIMTSPDIDNYHFNFDRRMVNSIKNSIKK